MRKVMLAAVALFAVGSFGAAHGAQRAADARIAVCQKTKSATRPYVRVLVTGAALRAAQRSSDTIVPAPKTCPRTLLTPTTGGVEITTNLLGVAEQPEPGDPDGSGTASIRLRTGQARVCFRIETQNIGSVTAAHIHKGSAEEAGPAVVPLTTAGSGCVNAARVLVKDILANRGSYYVNVHTSDFPNGAVRGQLAAPTGITLFRSALAGANERPNPADPNGVGTGQFWINADKGRICYALAVRNITLPATGAHIHRGDANSSGPVVIPFANPGTSGTSSGCMAADAALLREIVANPANFYANVHSTQYPAGAVRAQLTPA